MEKVLDVILDPLNILITVLVLLFIGRYVFNITYINCFDIIKKHLQCFKKQNGKVSIMAMFLYFILPLLIAGGVVKIKVINDAAINIITVMVSILTAMFFTLLTLILDMREKVRSNNHYSASDAAISVKVLKETYYSIMFEILISIVILILCFVQIFAEKVDAFGSFAIYYLTFVMLINLFMVLKRIFKVIDKDLEMK